MRTIFGIILAAAALLSVTAMTLLFVMPAAWVCAWIRSGGDRPRETHVLQGFPRAQPPERHRDRVEAPRNGCSWAAAETGAAS